MKLVKIVTKPAQPIVGIPGAENLTINENILVSDSKYRLLDFNHVKMIVMKEFTETAVVDITDLDMNKAYIIKKLVSPEDFKIFDPSKYEVGDYVLVYKEGPVLKAKKPVMRKPLPGFKFTPEELTAAIEEYDKAMKEYDKAVAKYEEEVKTFIEKVASVPSFGYLVEIVSATQFKVIADLSYETTKTVPQFHEWGKLPASAPSLVTKAVGGFSAGTSIKGMTVVDILTKMLGLEFEEDLVGEVSSKATDSEESRS